jgi:hypothetical protein
MICRFRLGSNVPEADVVFQKLPEIFANTKSVNKCTPGGTAASRARFQHGSDRSPL